MKIIAKCTAIASVQVDTLVIGVFSDDVQGDVTGDAELNRVCSSVVAARDFCGGPGESALLYVEGAGITRLLLVGLGDRKDWSVSVLRRSVSDTVVALKQYKTKKLAVSVSSFVEQEVGSGEVARTVVETTTLGFYTFSTLSDSVKKYGLPRELIFVCREKSDIKEIRSAGKVGQIIANATNFARDLQNTPGNMLTPAKLARQARTLAKEARLECKVLNEREILAAKMGGVLAVAKGSKEPPRFIILQYKSGKRNAQKIALVGKGVTFDSGGISIKPGDRMEEMKFDMSGAAAVLGAIKAVSELSLPVDVVALVPAVENLPDANALKPGDVITARSGKTIEVINTDAEGRIILADALTYARKFKPDVVIDLATLTGACVIALGHHATGLMGTDQGIMDALREAGEQSGERVWQLPLWQDYFDDIKGDYADIKNSGGRAGGTITAAAFLGQFTRDMPWAHLDIAGTAWINKAKGCQETGGTGVGVRLLTQLLLNRVQRKGSKS